MSTDIPDLIAGALGVSRGTAYDLMREALAEQPAQQRHISYVCPQCFWSLDEKAAQPQQEPVYVYTCKGCESLYRENDVSCDCTVDGLMEFNRHILLDDTSPPAQRKPMTDELDVKRLNHCMIAVRDWLGGGCDINDIPRPEIAALVAFTDYGIKGDA